MLPNIEWSQQTDAADTDDTKRAMLGLCTSNGQFFSTSTAGDTVLRSTDNSALLFGEGQSERFRMDMLRQSFSWKNGGSAFANAGVEIDELGEITVTRAGDLLTTRLTHDRRSAHKH